MYTYTYSINTCIHTLYSTGIDTRHPQKPPEWLLCQFFNTKATQVAFVRWLEKMIFDWVLVMLSPCFGRRSNLQRLGRSADHFFDDISHGKGYLYRA